VNVTFPVAPAADEAVAVPPHQVVEVELAHVPAYVTAAAVCWSAVNRNVGPYVDRGHT
jgi:hypothetical protein